MATEIKKLFDDGGPAFPTRHNVGDPRSDGFFSEPGMYLRDYFAAHAREADIEEHRATHCPPGGTRSTYTMTREEARYAFADAMLDAKRRIRPTVDPAILDALKSARAIVGSIAPGERRYEILCGQLDAALAQAEGGR